MQEVKSSAISHIGYDPDTKVMTIRFHGGKEHEYHDVSPQAHADFLSADSIGKHFALHVRDKYHTTKKEAIPA